MAYLYGITPRDRCHHPSSRRPNNPASDKQKIDVRTEVDRPCAAMRQTTTAPVIGRLMTSMTPFDVQMISTFARAPYDFRGRRRTKSPSPSPP
jgi:hypothetical protein